MNPANLSILDASHAMKNGKLTSSLLVEAHLEKIDHLNHQIKAFIYINEEDAFVAAKHADQQRLDGIDLGILHGIPFAIKDIIDVDGWPVSWGSHQQKNRIATCTAPIVTQLCQAGAIALGLVATYELATVGPDLTSLYPQPRNPWNLNHITGGSSSGSAAAVASGMVRLAIGTDTGGSVRSPASYCGVVGLKPNYRDLCTDNIMPLSPTLDHVGVICPTAKETYAVFQQLTNGTNRSNGIELTSAENLTIGFPRNWYVGEKNVDPKVIELMDNAAAQFSLLGAKIELVDLPRYAEIEQLGSDILHAELFKAHGSKKSAFGQLGKKVQQSLMMGSNIGNNEYETKLSNMIQLRRELDGIINNYDAMILPTTLTTAPSFEDILSNETFWSPMLTIPFNLTGHPAISVPMGFINDLPIGLQIIGPHNATNDVLAIASLFEINTQHNTGFIF